MRIISYHTYIVSKGGLISNWALFSKNKTHFDNKWLAGKGFLDYFTCYNLLCSLVYQLWITRNGKTYRTMWLFGETSYTPSEPLGDGSYTWYVETASPCALGSPSSG